MMMNEAIEMMAEAIWTAGWDVKPGNIQWADVRDPVRAKYVRMAWAATNMAIEILRQESDAEQERCDPVAGTHSNPHRGCILR